MTFLNPAILLGLLAATVPIIIHLFNKRKLETVEFSTLKFLKELQKTKIKRIKLKQIILLILRVLIIVFIVSAFARPAIKSINSSYGSSSSKSTGVFILDDSPSMSIIEGRGSKFSQAKHLLKNILNFYQDGDDIIIYYASQPDRNYKFNSPEQAINFVNKKDVSHKPGYLLECIRKGSGKLKGSSNINKEIFLLSDLQETNISPIDSITSYLYAKGINFYITNFDNSPKINYSLNSISINDQIYELNKEISFKINATGNFGDRVLSLFINKSRAAQKRIEFGKAKHVSEEFAVTLKEAGLLRIHATLEDDDFNYDNSIYEAISIPQIISVGLIYNNIEEITFIKSALEIEEGKSIKLISINWNQINSFDLNKFDVIVLVGIGDNNIERIIDFSKTNKGLVIFTPDKFSGYNKLAKRLNLPQVVEFVSSAQKETVNAFDKVNYSHPILKNIFGIEKPSIESPMFYKYTKLNSKPETEEIISLKDGSPFLSAQISKNNIILFNVLPVLDWSSFPISGLFAPLVYRAIIFGSQSNLTKENYSVGDKIILQFNETTTGIVKVIRPNGGEEKLNVKNSVNGKLYYDKTDIPGVYQFYSGDKLIRFAVVNYSPMESDLSYFSIDKIQSMIESTEEIKVIPISEKSNLKETIYQSRFGIELWKYFLIIALLLTLAEMLVSRNSKKEILSLKDAGNRRTK